MENILPRPIQCALSPTVQSGSGNWDLLAIRGVESDQNRETMYATESFRRPLMWGC